MADVPLQSDSSEAQTHPAFYRKLCNWNFLSVLALGQFLSLLLCGTGVFSQLLVTDYDIQIPTTQSFFNYLLLGIVHTSRLACHPTDFKVILKDRGWKYFLLAVIDVEANFLVVKAFQFTNLTSIQVLDCFSLVSVMVISWIFLKIRYQCVHYTGVFICLVGIACLVIADYYGSRNYGPGKNQVIGDVLVLCGAVMYGMSNVAQEFVVKTFSRVEFLGMIGLFGSFISVIQMLILERRQLANIDWDYKIVLFLLGFGVCLFLLYNLMPVAMNLSSAVVVNLSLLTANFYSLLCGLFVFHYKFSALYLGALAFIMIGIVVYNVRPTPERAASPTLSYRAIDGQEDSASSPSSSTFHAHVTSAAVN